MVETDWAWWEWVVNDPDGFSADTWYLAMAMLLAERSPA